MGHRIVAFFHYLQVGWALVCLWLIGRSFEAILFRAPLDHRRFLSALLGALERGEPSRARQLAEAARPAWAAEIASGMLEARGADEREVAKTERWSQIAGEAARRLHVLRGCARIALPLALLGMILELTEALGAGGLTSAGAERGDAVDHAALCFAIGLSTTFVCYGASVILRRHVVENTNAVQRLARELAQRGPGSDRGAPPAPFSSTKTTL